MLSKDRDGLPAYQRIQGVLRKQIDSGDLRSGDLVASERRLAKIHQVSLMTARHALASLEREGIVERRQGIGTFVAAPKIHFNKLMSYTEHMASRGFIAGAKVLVSKTINNEEAATRLSLPPKSRVIKVERVRHVAGKPFALETCYLCPEFSGALSGRLEHESLFTFLERNCKVALSYADEEIDATNADHRIAKLLQLARGEPLLRIRQVIYSTSGKAITYVLGLYRSDRHSLCVRRFRQDAGRDHGRNLGLEQSTDTRGSASLPQR